MHTPTDTTPAELRQLTDDDRRERFDALVDALLHPLYWHVRRLVVVHEDAEDVVQQAFLAAYEQFGTFRGGEQQLRAWFYRIATNAALTHLRRRKRWLFASDAATGRELAQQVADESGPEADEVLVRFQQAVLSLPLKQRLVFNLRYYDELPYARIAEVLGQREETLKVNYHHAVENLKKKLTL